MKAYKGFKLGMVCQDFKYEKGKTYEESDTILCSNEYVK